MKLKIIYIAKGDRMIDIIKKHEIDMWGAALNKNTNKFLIDY